MKYFVTLLLTTTIIGCGGGSGSSNGGNSGATSGVITLSGDDTTLVGAQLDTGNVGSSLAADSQPDYIVIVDQASSVTFTEPNILTPNLSDPNNGFVLVVTDDAAGSDIKGISMSIFKGGSKFDYACTTPISTFINCGTDSIDLNITNKTVTFNDANVLNTDTDSVLTLDGTLTWTGGGDGNNGSSENSGGGALTNITGVWKQDDPFLSISTLGNADEVYEIYKEDGTNLTFGYFMNENPSCYDRSLSTYEDLGGGDISIDGDAPYNFTISGNTMTVSFSGDSFTLARSSLTESEFTPICP